MLSKRLDELTRDDIQALIDRQDTEDRFLDYKERLPCDGVSDPQEREKQKDAFRLDVMALANTDGGHLLFGVEEQKGRSGYPERIAGIAPGANLDQEIQRLHQLLDSTRVVPRISGVRIRALAASPGEAPVIVIAVPKSLNGPHALFDGVNMRFNGRSSTGNFQLDYWQVREAFALSEVWPERIRQFHEDRFKDIHHDRPHSISKNHRFILVHLIPVAAFSQRTPLLFGADTLKGNIGLLAPVMGNERGGIPPQDLHTCVDYRWNIDGPFLFHPVTGGNRAGYLQILAHRGGAIEAVDTWLLDPETWSENRPMDLIYTRILEDCLISATTRWMRAMRDVVSATPPIVMMISLRGVEGFRLRNSDDLTDPTNRVLRTQPEKYKVDRDEIRLPEILIESFDEEPARFLRDAFNALWQAAGWDHCLNYDEQGKRLQ